MTDYKKPVPTNRTIVPGNWSDLLDLQSQAYNTDNIGVTSINITDQGSLSASTIAGTMHAVNNDFSLTAGESVGYKIRGAGGTFVRFVHADAITVKYVTSFTGLIVKLGNSKALNQSVDNGYNAYYERYTNLVFSEDDVILSGGAPMTHGMYSDNDIYIVITNNTASIIADSFSAGLQSVGSFTVPYGLSANTLLTETTEMSIYD